MDAIEKAVNDRKTDAAVVVGGGYIGLEIAEALVRRGLRVTIVEMADQVMTSVDPEMATPLHEELKKHGVDLRLRTSATGFKDDNGLLQADLSTGETIPCVLAILAVGVRPRVDLARNAGLEIGKLGGIVVDDGMRTSDKNIYAVGDAVEVREFVSEDPSLFPLAGPANRQGRIAADNIFGRDTRYKKTQGTAICKVFDLAIGMTGMNERVLRRKGLPFEKIYVHPFNHAGYYPGGATITLKLLFHPTDGKILGAQAIGSEGVDKRIDVLAVALRAGLSVFDLEEMELCYAPPYGSAKDVVNYAGFVAANVIRGDVRLCHAKDVNDPKGDQALLDVRTKGEVARGTIPGSIAIHVDDLRDHLDELPRDKELLVFCWTGVRSYLAYRILSQNGFNCRNLIGGYKTYLMTLAGRPRDSLGKSRC
jgi:rhodanese-related sulfurtransferase